MKIQTVSIDGFKNLSNVKITFDNITALVALNNFGKSNVLSGIDFGLDFIKANSEEKAVMSANTNLIPINPYLKGTNFKFEVEVLTDYDKKEYRVQYGFEFAWQFDEDKIPKIVNEYLRIRLNQKGSKYTQLIGRTLESTLYKSSPTGRCSTKIKVEPLELVINKLKAYDELYYAQIIKNINSMKIYMENNLDVKSFYQVNPIIFKDFENEMINADNLPRIIFNLKKQHPDRFELLKNMYLQLFPDIQDIVVRDFQLEPSDETILPENVPFIISNSIYVLFVKDKNLISPVDFSMMSDGAKRVFMILTKIIISNVSNISLIAVEEPENSVHPGLFKAYLQVISQLLDDCKVIITSHSPYIISYLKPSKIHVGVNKRPGVAEFFTFKKSGQRQLEKDSSDFNMSMGDYLFSMLADSQSNISEYLECGDNE